MNVVPLTVETGRATGKGPAKRLRTEGKIPGTVYGLDFPTITVAVERSEFRRALTTAAGVNALIQLTYNGESHYTLVKEIQRHPVRRDPIHIDLQRIDPTTPMSLTVPIVLTGDPKQVISNGGIMEQAMNALRVSVRPDAIPNDLRIDVSHLEIDSVITVGELTLPDGVTTDVDLSTPIVTASLTRAAMTTHEEGEGEDGDETSEEDSAGESSSAGED